MSMTNRKSFLYYAIGYMGSSVIYKGTGFVAFLWLAANMGPTTYATMGMLLALQAGITTFAAAGTVEALLGQLKSIDSKSEQLRFYRATTDIFWGLALGALCIVAVLSAPLMELTHSSGKDVLAVAIAGVLSAYYLLQAQLLRLRERHIASMVVSTVPPFCGLLVGVFAYEWFSSLSAFLVSTALVLLIFFPILMPIYHRSSRPLLQIAIIRPIAFRMPPFIVVALLSWLAGYGSTFLINGIFTTEEGARFTFVYTLSSALQLVATSLNQVWSPRFFNIVHTVSLDRLEKQNSKFYLLLGIAIGAVGALIIFMMAEVVPLFFGAKLQHYQNMELEMFCMFAVYSLSINWYHSQNYFLAHGEGRAFMGVTILSLLLGTVIWLVMALAFGLTGAYLGFIAQALLKSVIANVWASRRWNIRVLWMSPVLSLLLLSLGAIMSFLVEFK